LASEILFVYDLDLFVEYFPSKPVDCSEQPIRRFAFDDEFFEIRFSQCVPPACGIALSIRFPVWVWHVYSTPLASRSLRRYVLFMSLAEIEKAVDELSPKELTRLAAYIARRDRLAWDQQIEEDFSHGGKHEKVLEKIDAEIDSGDFTPLP